MNKNTPILAAAAGVLLLAAPALAQDKLYVASEGAKLKADKSASSDTVAELPVGTQLSVQGQEESWYKVSTGGKSGWIYRGKVAATAPEPSKQGGDNLFGGAGSSNIMVSEADSARSMRGLNESEQQAARLNRNFLLSIAAPYLAYSPILPALRKFSSSFLSTFSASTLSRAFL